MDEEKSEYNENKSSLIINMIPKKIYQSYKTKDLPPKMKDNVQKLKDMNPEYEYELWDDNDCRKFLLDFFGENYANAFDVLAPGAAKCDFWRYAMLYTKGGVYMDIDLVPLVPLREIIDDSDEFVSVVDRQFGNQPLIYQAFIASVPKHPINLTSLQLSFANIVNRKNSMSVLDITGPVTIGIAFNLYFNKKNTHEKIKIGMYDNNKIKMLDNTKLILTYVYDLNKRPIFKQKDEGYQPINSYGFMSTHYHDDPYKTRKRIIIAIILSIIIIAIIGLILTFVFKKKWTRCEQSCSMRSSE